MDGIFGADFDNDLFNDESKPKTVQEESSPWKPLTCEPGWFHHKVTDRNNESEVNGDHSSVSAKHYQAHHFFLNGKYVEASETYSELLNLVPVSNTQLRREISDGLTRSLMKSGKYEEALAVSNELLRNCKNKWQRAAYHSLLAKIFRNSHNYDAEIEHLQSAIMVHQLNPDLWMRIAESYFIASGGDDILAVGTFKLSQKKDLTWFAAFSLIRTFMLLKSLCGGSKTFGRARNRNLLEKVEPAVATFPEEFFSKAYQFLSQDLYSLEQQRENAEFVDLGSSKNQKTNEEDEQEKSDSEAIRHVFESRWFSFGDTLNEIV